MDIYDPQLWNDDGSPRKPQVPAIAEDPNPATPFLDFAYEADLEAALNAGTADQREVATSAFLNRLRREARANTPASVGDIVHVWSHEGTCLAAIVTRAGVMEGDADAVTLFPVGIEPRYAECQHVENKSQYPDLAPLTWHWPESE